MTYSMASQAVIAAGFLGVVIGVCGCIVAQVVTEKITEHRSRIYDRRGRVRQASPRQCRRMVREYAERVAREARDDIH